MKHETSDKKIQNIKISDWEDLKNGGYQRRRVQPNWYSDYEGLRGNRHVDQDRDPGESFKFEYYSARELFDRSQNA